MPETALLAPVRPRIAALTLVAGAAIGVLATLGIATAAPASAAGPARAVVMEAADLGIGLDEAEAATAASRAALNDAAVVVTDARSSGLDLGPDSIAIDTAGLLSALDRLDDPDADAVLDRVERTGDLASETEQVVTQSAAVRERLDTAVAQKRAAEAAVAALAAANTPDGARAVAQQIAASDYGWGADQFSCLNSLWQKESGWDYQAYNPSGATGIPQSLPGNKMASFGADWQTNATTQIRWGLDYIQRVYGSPCSAWGHSQAVNWY
ncbi:aggregation-promoting factor C-terminal-like domain-containing protein [Microbacterium sp. A588]